MKRGFTLLEVIITLALMAGGMTALLMAFSLATGTSAGIEEQETAVLIANAKMEELRSIKYANLLSSTTDSTAMFSDLTGYTVTVTTTKPVNPAQVTTMVSWPVKGGRANVTLTTLRADY